MEKTVEQMLISGLKTMKFSNKEIIGILSLLRTESQQIQLMDYMAEVRTMDHQLIFRKMEDILTR